MPPSSRCSTSYLKMDLKAVAADKEANEMGRRLYLTYCMQCHGSDAKGSKGFPNLADGDWLWGGEPEQIIETIANGRNGVMPPYGGNEEAVGGASGAKEIAHYVRSLSGLASDSCWPTKARSASARSAQRVTAPMARACRRWVRLT